MVRLFVVGFIRGGGIGVWDSGMTGGHSFGNTVMQHGGSVDWQTCNGGSIVVLAAVVVAAVVVVAVAAAVALGCFDYASGVVVVCCDVGVC